MQPETCDPREFEAFYHTTRELYEPDPDYDYGGPEPGYHSVMTIYQQPVITVPVPPPTYSTAPVTTYVGAVRDPSEHSPFKANRPVSHQHRANHPLNPTEAREAMRPLAAHIAALLEQLNLLALQAGPGGSTIHTSRIISAVTRLRRHLQDSQQRPLVESGSQLTLI